MAPHATYSDDMYIELPAHAINLLNEYERLSEIWNKFALLTYKDPVSDLPPIHLVGKDGLQKLVVIYLQAVMKLLDEYNIDYSR